MRTLAAFALSASIGLALGCAGTGAGTNPGTAGAALGAGPGASLFVVVRHAEKVLEPKTDDPELTPAGTTRAEALSRMFAGAGVRAIYATEWRRTQLTVAPLAREAGLEVRTVSAKEPGELARRLLAEHRGQLVIVAGHSNTVPDVLRELGVADVPAIGDDDYDNLFLVVAEEGRPPRLVRLRFPSSRPDPAAGNPGVTPPASPGAARRPGRSRRGGSPRSATSRGRGARPRGTGRGTGDRGRSARAR